MQAHRQPDAFEVYWADNLDNPNANAGVATIVFTGPQASPLQASNHRPHTSGRLQLLDISWAGHTFCLINSYWPHASSVQREQFLQAVLAPAAALQQPVCLVGDFNFTPDPPTDRRPLPSPGRVRADQRTAHLFTTLLPQLFDVFQVQPRGCPRFTYLSGRHTARLDRIYCSQALLPHAASLSVSPTPRGTHHLLTMSLLPAQAPQPRGPGRRAIPSHLPSNPEVAQCLLPFVQRAVAYGLTLSHQDLLLWWPRFHTQYASLARMLTWQDAAASKEAALQLQAAQDVATAAALALEEAPTAWQPAALQHARNAHDTLRTLTHRLATGPAHQAATTWATTNERPSPLTTNLIHRSAPPQSVRMLRNAEGRPCTTNRSIATAMATHFAQISSPPQVDPDAQQRVLSALQAAAAAGVGQPGGAVRCIPAHLADAAGAPTITEAEVREALAKTDTHSSAGPDGLPYGFWKVGDCALAPLLAALFTAMHATNTVPPGFTLGTITSILKPGAADPADPAAYRPITLLNTLYRTLSRVLAHRFGQALTAAIGSEQCGFLPGRRIEDAINTADLVAAAVMEDGSHGAAVHLDIAKAFDTVDRDFLFQAMQCMGSSPGMLTWTRLLLTNTAASAQVNGVESDPMPFHAGVRQGCPLSPLLYLYVAQALSSWLQAQRAVDGTPAIGITIGGAVYVSSHMADDTGVYLGPPLQQQAAALLHALQVFHAATGQAINVTKCAALLFGSNVPYPPPATLAGIQVTTSLTSLGIPRESSLPPPQAPAAPAYALRSALRPPPSHSNPPSQVSLQLWQRRIQRAAARLRTVLDLPLSVMGRGLAASTYVLSTFLYHAEFAGLPEAATEFAIGLARQVGPGIPRLLMHGSPLLGGFGLLPLRAHTTARHAAMATRLLTFLCTPPTAQPQVPLPPVWFQVAAHILRKVCDTLHPAHTLLAAAYATREEVAGGILDLTTRQLIALPQGPLTRMAAALQTLQMVAPLQAPAELSADAVVRTPQSNPALPRPALSHIHWQASATSLCPAGAPVPVRPLTTLLSSAATEARTNHHSQFIHAATGQQPSHASRARLSAAFARVWRLPWDNRLKEPWYRAAVNALPGAHIPAARWTCPCTTLHLPTTANHHTLWDCPVSLALRQHLQLSLPNAAAITKPCLWLLHPPSPALVSQAWEVVAVAAVEAMDYGRRRMWSLRIAGVWPPADIGTAVAAVSQSVILRFWLNLDTFVSLNPNGPRSWRSMVHTPPGHPFLVYDGHTLSVTNAPRPRPPQPVGQP